MHPYTLKVWYYVTNITKRKSYGYGKFVREYSSKSVPDIGEETEESIVCTFKSLKKNGELPLRILKQISILIILNNR